jgi:(2Fe-2S) ferredoxin
MSLYDFHVFVCENERAGTDPRGCCASRGAKEFTQKLKELVKTKGTQGRKIRVNKAGCLDLCAQGAVVVVYPEGVWYRGVTSADAEEIYSSHLLAGLPVERLRIPQRASSSPTGA